jgi:lysophospholipase L1-like esterase
VTTIVLFGDSMLARVGRDRIAALEAGAGPDAAVLNCAVGGWTSGHGLRRAGLAARVRPDVVVLSFGANDCKPALRVDRADFAANLAGIRAAFAGARMIGFLPPSLVERDGTGPEGRTNADLAGYRKLLAEAVDGHVLDPDAVLAPVIRSGTPVHEDGLHLTADAYALVIPALAAVVRAAE